MKKKGVEALLMRIIESALFKIENNHVQENLHKKILICSENSFVTPSLTLPHRGGGAGWGALSWFVGGQSAMTNY